MCLVICINCLLRIVNVNGKWIVKVELIFGVDDILIELFSVLILWCIIFIFILWLDKLFIWFVVEKLGKNISLLILLLDKLFDFEIRLFLIVFLCILVVFRFCLLFIILIIILLFWWNVLSVIVLIGFLFVVICLFMVFKLWLREFFMRWIIGLDSFFIIVLLSLVCLLSNFNLICLLSFCEIFWIKCGKWLNIKLIGNMWICMMFFCKLCVLCVNWVKFFCNEVIVVLVIFCLLSWFNIVCVIINLFIILMSELILLILICIDVDFVFVVVVFIGVVFLVLVFVLVIGLIVLVFVFFVGLFVDDGFILVLNKFLYSVIVILVLFLIYLKIFLILFCFLFVVKKNC